MITQLFTVNGMTCSVCSGTVERIVSSLDGVASAQVNLLTATLTVSYDEDLVSPEQICSAIEDVGFEALVRQDSAPSQDSATSAKHDYIPRLIWSGALLLPLMILSMGPMWGLDLSWFPGGHLGMGWAQLILCLPILWLNRSFFIKGFATLFRLDPTMDSLVAIGSLASVVSGIISLFTHTGQGHLPLYFESAAMILTLVTLGKYLEHRAKGKTGKALEMLRQLIPDTITLVDQQGNETQVPTASVQVGQLIRILPGQRIPLDGEIRQGVTSVDESSLTGESLPVDKVPGDPVTSGTMNCSGAITVEAKKVGADTTISQMIQMVENAAGSKAPIARIADRVSRFFVPSVMLIALLAFVLWLVLYKDVAVATNMGISVLVISCPCALGLATPTAIMVATGKGATLGLLFRSAEALEITHTIDTVLLDKTGTITSGTPSVNQVLVLHQDEFVPLDELLSQGHPTPDSLSVALGLEKLVQHPLANAIVDYCTMLELLPARIESCENIPGMGVTTMLDGATVAMGNARLMESQGITIPALPPSKGPGARIYMGHGGTLVAIFDISDSIRGDSIRAIQQMHDLGLKVYMVTGDSQDAGEFVGQQVGVDRVFAQVLPANKERIVSQLVQEGHRVAMIGDGINDSPALSAATVGVAIGGGADIAVESADLVLMHSTITDFAKAYALSASTVKTIRRGLFWALFYNTVCIPLAAGVLYLPLGLALNPMIAAAAMSLSSVSVVLNALSLRGKKI